MRLADLGRSVDLAAAGREMYALIVLEAVPS